MRLTPALVAQCFRVVPEPPLPDEWVRVDDDVLGERADRLLREAAGPLWVFAYGSLIWRPDFAPIEIRRALARGWHRSFCIELQNWRGTPDAPGLMLALERGGSCTGFAMQLDPASAANDLVTLLRREVPYEALLDNHRWITLETHDGPMRALVFYAAPSGMAVSPRLPLPVVAARLARACGEAGSCAEYLYNTVAHLEAEGLRDRNLWQLQEMVAEEIEAAATAEVAERLTNHA